MTGSRWEVYRCMSCRRPLSWWRRFRGVTICASCEAAKQRLQETLDGR